MQQAAQLLDELMGRHRNVNPNEKVKEPNWEDPEFCKYYTVRFCPHDLFVNTRADLGVCPKVHDDEVKSLFEKAESNFRKIQYTEEFLRFCRNMINDVERKIQKGKQRLELMNNKGNGFTMNPAQSEKNQEEINALTQEIAQLVNEAEEAGLRGDVEQAQDLMKRCDTLKEQKEDLVRQAENNHYSLTAELAAAQEKQMEVCPVCGAFLIVGDAQSRIDDHLMGKQHVGLREAYREMTAAKEKELEDRDKKRREDRDRPSGRPERERRDKERPERERERTERERERPERERERPERERDRTERDRRDKDRSERDKERERERSNRTSRDDRGRHGDRSERDKRQKDSSRDDSRRNHSRSRDRSRH